MPSLSQAKTLGGVGAILVFIPFVSLVGYILIILAVKDISERIQDKKVFDNILIAAITGIVGAIAGGVVMVTGSIGSVFTLGLSAFFGVVAGLLVVWIFLIISAVFLRRAYDSMAQKLNVDIFRTAAMLYLIGAILTVVFVGFIILFVAQILQAIAYFSIPEQPQTGSLGPAPVGVPPPAQQSATPQQSDTKFCVSCGTKIPYSATFCSSCGSKQTA